MVSYGASFSPPAARALATAASASPITDVARTGPHPAASRTSRQAAGRQFGRTSTSLKHGLTSVKEPAGLAYSASHVLRALAGPCSWGYASRMLALAILLASAPVLQ